MNILDVIAPLNPFNINNDQDGSSIRLVTALLAHLGLNSSLEVTNMTGPRPSRSSTVSRITLKGAPAENPFYSPRRNAQIHQSRRHCKC